MPELKSLIKNNVVNFDFYRSNVMYYTVYDPSDGKYYRFPVRLNDAGEATLLAEDKAILYMRWIRKAQENNELHEVYKKK